MKSAALARLATIGILCCLVLPAWPQQSQEDLTQLSLVDLMNIEVISVARKDQKLAQTASAVFVISQDDIRRSGATNIPDLLRMVPGVDVAQISSNKWAISVRGFNNQYSNKLLVMIDGRTIYSPIMSGVFWDEQDVPLATIDRIEVIRGPGAAVWGANAVNGVISVITKKAEDTQGGMLSTGAGSYEHGFGAATYGGKFRKDLSYRVSADGFARNHFPVFVGRNGKDDWNNVHGGFRLDATVSTQDSITLEGDSHRGTSGEIGSPVAPNPSSASPNLPLSDHFSGWDLLSRWDHVGSPHSGASLQAYFDRSTRGDGTYGIGLDTFDLDFQHHAGWGERQDIVWGLGYRANSDSNLTTKRISFNPVSRTTQLFSSFVQDEIAILPGLIYLNLGAKLEHNDYTGFGVQPSAHIRWTPNHRRILWAAVSQAERTPARSDRDIRVNFTTLAGTNNLPILVSLFGNPMFKNEVLRAVEAGYRTQLTNRFSLSGTTFFNHYQHLATVESGTPFKEGGPSSLHIVFPTSFSNYGYGETHGLEVDADWRVVDHWTLTPGYSFLTAHIHREASSRDLTSAAGTEGGSPSHQAQLRSNIYLPGHWAWNASAYFVGRLPAQAVPSYTRLDTNMVKRLTERLSIALVGENLLKDHHLESHDIYTTLIPSQVKRSAYAKIEWQF